MAKTLHIVLIGGSANQVKRFKAICLNRFALLELPEDFIQQWDPMEILAEGSVVFLFDNSAQKTTRALRLLQKKLPGIPIIVVGKRPTKKRIIQTFRRGADDFLIWPAEEKEILLLLNRYLSARRLSPRQFFGKWWRKIKMIWNKSAADSPYRHPRAKAMGIVTDGFASSDFSIQDVAEHHDLSIRFFGRFEVYFRGKKMDPIPGKKVNTLFAYLLYHHKRPIHRDKLMGQFWGNNTPSSARNSLNVAIYTIRKHFEKICPHQELILYNRETYVLNSELDILTDVDQFVHYWQRGRDIEASQGLESAMGAFNKALALYRGDFLEEMLYEEWCEPERDSLMETYLLTLDRMSSYFLNEGSYTASINLCKKILEKDDCLEDGHRRLIICYNRLGMRDKAIRQYHKCARILKSELCVEPSDQTKEIFVEISEG